MEKYNVVDILLVEDDIHDAEITIRALKNKNLSNNLLHLQDGAEALDFIFSRGDYTHRSNLEPPKLVLLDLNMPRVNGLEVLATIRAYEKTKLVPVAILTSSKEDPDIQACYALGATTYIVKPVQFENFAEAVSRLGLYWLLINEAPR